MPKVLKLRPLRERAREKLGERPGWNKGRTRQAAADYWEAQEFEDVERPDVPATVYDAVDLSSDDLGRSYMHHVAYLEFLEREVALLDIDSTEADVYEEQTEALVRLGKVGTVKDKDTKTRLDPAYIEAQLDALEKQAKLKLLRARLKSFERRANALSREMTRRQGDLREPG